MRIEIANLTEENLQDAPAWESHPFSCKTCLYWECSPEAGPATPTSDEALRRKTDWLRRTNGLFGDCGKLAYVDGVAAGYAQYAPGELLPVAASYPAGPPSRDAVLLACLFVPERRFRGLGLGSRLLASVLAESRQRGVTAVETFARRGSADNPSGPEGFYLAKGFVTFRDDAEFPLLRLDL